MTTITDTAEPATIYGHARLGTQPVLIEWAGKIGTFPRVGTFHVYDLNGEPLPGAPVSEHRLTFGGCSDRHHPSRGCPFLAASKVDQ